MSFIHNNSSILSKYLVVQTQLATYRKKSVSGAQNNKVSEPRIFSVATNSLGIDADEVITEALP